MPARPPRKLRCKVDKAVARILSLQASLTARVAELEAAQLENRELKLRIPI
ncbi:MAG TPA: hypothetical protein VII74_03780 [Chthoniobacterales bacterium]